MYFSKNELELKSDSRRICLRLRLQAAELRNYCNAESRRLRLSRGSSIIPKNEDTWYKALRYFRYRIRYSPESIQGVVARTTLYTLLILTAARGCSLWSAVILGAGSPAAGAILAASGVLTTSGPSAVPAILFIFPV